MGIRLRSLIEHPFHNLDPQSLRSHQNPLFNNPIIISFPNSIFKKTPHPCLQISASSSSLSMPLLSDHHHHKHHHYQLFKDLEFDGDKEDGRMFKDRDSIFIEDLDEWVRGSVVEIVKNLKKAPLLVHLYSGDHNDGLMEVKIDKGFAEDWSTLFRGWVGGDSKSPDGIILVEELKDDDGDLGIQVEERETKIWGLLIQGKGGLTTCYLLKTCRVSSGVGVFGTHFSLVKVTSFSESAFSQITNTWCLR